MKRLYKVVLFFAVLHLVVIMISLLNIFPSTLYSDAEINTLRENVGTDPLSIFSYLFAPDTNIWGSNTISVSAIITAFAVGGTAIAVLTKSWTPAIITLLGLSFLPMLLRSRTFFDKMFTTWDSASLTYMAIIFGVVLILFVVFTILEVPSHGDI